MQPADEGPCAPKMCRQQRGPYSTLKPFQSKRPTGKSRFDRAAVMELPLFGDGGGHQFTFHPGQPHPFQPQHHHPRLQLHQAGAATSSSQQHHHRFPCENRPSSRVPTSTSAAAAAASFGTQQRRASGGAAAHQEHRYSPGRVALNQDAPDCTYGISSGGFQTC